jgi:protein required for attachment to host cells
MPASRAHTVTQAALQTRKIDEDGSVRLAGLLNSEVLDERIKSLVVVAAPRTLSEMGKSSHQSLLRFGLIGAA